MTPLELMLAHQRLVSILAGLRPGQATYGQDRDTVHVYRAPDTDRGEERRQDFSLTELVGLALLADVSFDQDVNAQRASGRKPPKRDRVGRLGATDYRIRDAIAAGPSDGTTCLMVEQNMGLMHQSASASISRLVANGMIRHTGAFTVGRRGEGRIVRHRLYVVEGD